eukprot:scaffold2281_cov215-Alexandrium_tamarense.AAC.5
MNAASTDPQDLAFRGKPMVLSSLAELTRLPMLSVVEEKLCIRNELIDWNNEALGAISTATTTSKVPFERVEALYNQLLSIVGAKSERRMSMCRHLRPNKSVDSDVQLFAGEDERLICTASSSWIREQYRIGYEWKQQYDAVISALQSKGFFSDGVPPSEAGVDAPQVEFERIAHLLGQHSGVQMASSFPNEYAHLDNVRSNAMRWSSRVDDIIQSEYSLQERCNRLKGVCQSRPKGMSMNPTDDAINLWIRVYSWPVRLEQTVRLFTNAMMNWEKNEPCHPQSRDGESNQMMKSAKEFLAPLMVEGQIFLTTNGGNPPLIMAEIRDEALLSIYENQSDIKVISASEVLGTGIHGKSVLDRIRDMEADRRSGSPLLLTQTLFWRLMASCFVRRMQRLETSDSTDDSVWKQVSLDYAKILLSYCPSNNSSDTTVVDCEGARSHLENMIRDAEQLQSRATAILSHTSDLLQTNCYSHKRELVSCIDGLKSIQDDFKSRPKGTAKSSQLLLKSSRIETAVAIQVKGVVWLMNAFSFPILFNASPVGALQTSNPRLPLQSLLDLQERIPFTTGDGVDPEIVRVGLLVNDLFQRAKLWQASVASFTPRSNNDTTTIQPPSVTPVVDLCTLQELVQSPLLSMVSAFVSLSVLVAYTL